MEAKQPAPVPFVVFANLFPLGFIVVTPAADEAISPQFILESLNRHARGDWGELDSYDWQANEAALAEGGRLFSIYREIDRAVPVRFYVITEADRSATTVLLPADY